MEKDAGDAVDHRLPHSPFRDRDDRRAGRHGLQGGDPEVLDSRNQQRARRCHQLDDARRIDPSEELDRRTVSKALELQFLASLPDDHQTLARVARRLNGQIDSLVRNQRRDHEIEILTLATDRELEETLVDERMDHLRGLPVTVTDARGDEMGVRDEGIDSIGGPAVPLPHRAGEGDRGQAPHRLVRRKVIVEPVPDVAHRSVAVTDVGSPPRPHALCRRMARRNDEVVAGKIPPGDRPRKERKKVAVV